MIANTREAISKPDGTYDYDMLDGYEDLKYVVPAPGVVW
jgi:hypothetical protein